MKIGFRAKNYSDVVCFDIDDTIENRDQIINDLFNYVSTSQEDEIDFLVTVMPKNTVVDK